MYRLSSDLVLIEFPEEPALRDEPDDNVARPDSLVELLEDSTGLTLEFIVAGLDSLVELLEDSTGLTLEFVVAGPVPCSCDILERFRGQFSSRAVFCMEVC